MPVSEECDMLVRVEKLCIGFEDGNGRNVVKDISFSIKKGTITALAGRSGCGKSITALALIGMLGYKKNAYAKGSITFYKDGCCVEMLLNNQDVLRKIRKHHISMIFQDTGAGLNPTQKIGAQIKRVIKLKEGIGKRSIIMDERVEELLTEAGLDAKQVSNKYPHELSGGMKQRVAIAMSLIGDPDLIIADEPTTALDAPTQEGILKLLEKLKKNHGCAILIISHDISLLKRISDEFLFMENGRIVDISNETEKLFYHNDRMCIAEAPIKKESRKVLIVNQLEKSFPSGHGYKRKGSFVLKDVSFYIKRGEVFAIAGKSGCGKSTLAKAIMRLIPIDSGNILFCNTDITQCDKKEFLHIRPKIQMIFQDTYSSLDPLMPSAKQIIEAVVDNKVTPKGEEKDYVSSLLSSCGITEEEAQKRPTELSGGQRQRISIARALALKPDLLIADEPVSSIDGIMKKQIIDLLMEQKRIRGLSLMIISHDLSFLRKNADRIAIMQDGRIIEMDDAENIFTHPVQPYTKQLVSTFEN